MAMASYNRISVDRHPEAGLETLVKVEAEEAQRATSHFKYGKGLLASALVLSMLAIGAAFAKNTYGIPARSSGVDRGVGLVSTPEEASTMLSALTAGKPLSTIDRIFKEVRDGTSTEGTLLELYRYLNANPEVKAQLLGGIAKSVQARPAAPAAATLQPATAARNCSDSDRPLDKVPANEDGIVLLTTAFLPQVWNQHVNEIFAALNTNLLNEHISAVHVLTETNCTELEGMLATWAKAMPDAVMILRHLRKKLTCKTTEDKTQPTYGYFFRYANQSLSNRIVLLANGDVVFDDTLGLIDPGPIKRQQRGYVLSVMSPPHNGAYKKAFNQECDTPPRCVVGNWAGGGAWGQTYAGCSWDAYIFSPPLSSDMDLGHVDSLVMNYLGAETLAAFQLEIRANISLSNPCYHVHAFHWHCQGAKMHSSDNMARADHPTWWLQKKGWPAHTRDAVSDVFPCWNCPGIKMPKGAVSTQCYCQNGTMVYSSQYEALRSNFRAQFVNPGVCCRDPNTCWNTPVQSLPHCIKADDMDCVTWEAVHPHTVY